MLFRSTLPVGRTEAVAGQDPNQDRDAEDPGERDVVREVHKRECHTTALAAAATADYPPLIRLNAIGENNLAMVIS